MRDVSSGHSHVRIVVGDWTFCFLLAGAVEPSHLVEANCGGGNGMACFYLPLWLVAYSLTDHRACPSNNTKFPLTESPLLTRYAAQ